MLPCIINLYFSARLSLSLSLYNISLTWGDSVKESRSYTSQAAFIQHLVVFLVSFKLKLKLYPARPPPRNNEKCNLCNVQVARCKVWLTFKHFRTNELELCIWWKRTIERYELLMFTIFNFTWKIHCGDLSSTIKRRKKSEIENIFISLQSR